MSLKNTDYLYGMVIFTGHETKVMKNSEEAKYKCSRLELLTNKTIKLVLIVQILMSIIGGVMGFYELQKNHDWSLDPLCIMQAERKCDEAKELEKYKDLKACEEHWIR